MRSRSRNRRPTRRLRTLAFLAASTLAVQVVAADARPRSPAPVAGQSSWRFDFGAAAARRGFLQVQTATAYSPQLGYGLENASHLQAATHSVCGDGVPFFFSVDVPEGNYDVTLDFGDDGAGSVATVKAEARRLLLERVQVARGKTTTRRFTVNVRSPRLASGESVRLKRDEQSENDWDSRLTLEFNNTRPCIRSLEISRSDHAITVYLAGDSTVTDQRREPWAAWGQMLPRFFGPGLAIANHAESGESLKSFIGEKRLPKLLETIQPGDYLFIQFAHNDQKPGPSHVDALSTYQEYLKRYLDEARQRKAIPVLVTSMHRRRFDEAGRIVNTLEDFPEAMRQLAKRENVPLIDLNAMSKTLFEALAPAGTLQAFVHYPAGTFPGQEQELKDDTHFNAYGAYELARCIVEGIRTNHLSIERYLLGDVPRFDPAHPDSAGAWKLPPSPFVTEKTPEGN